MHQEVKIHDDHPAEITVVDYRAPSRNWKLLALFLVLATAGVYYFSNPKPYNYYDYTFRIAENFLSGRIGILESPPSWLNEMFPYEGRFYAAFPLGSVLTMLPFVLLKIVGLIDGMPGASIAALIAGGICLFLLLIARHYDIPLQKQVLLALVFLFGAWMWTNVAMEGAWHLALGFGVLGELGAIYFTVFRPKPFLAGCFFALAFGNRTEIVLLAPLVLFLLVRSNFQPGQLQNNLRLNLKPIVLFCIVPFILGAATLAYNYLRFHSPFDFGYTYAPDVLNYWYRYGTHSIWYIPRNVQEMLLTQWKTLNDFPYLVPTGFGGAIWFSSPFLIYLFRWKAVDKVIWRSAWLAIALLTFFLWCHGSPGGWQYSYRYGMELLPWVFLILLENSPAKITIGEWATLVFSFLINAWATYLFFWTGYVKP